VFEDEIKMCIDVMAKSKNSKGIKTTAISVNLTFSQNVSVYSTI